MKVLKASRLKAVLDRARNAGQVEESATIAGLDLVFSSLQPEAYNAILEELKDVPENSYALCYQIEHVCRSIVAVDGESFRDVNFIESDPSEAGGPLIKVERHQWLKDNLVSTWSREMVQIAFRKVLDAIQGAEDKAAAGVKFRVEAESDEEKYRRLLTELKEVGTELPNDMREAILKEEGLLLAASKAELEDLEVRARAWAPDPSSAEKDAAEGSTSVPSSSPDPVKAPQQLVNAADPLAMTELAPSANVDLSRRIPLNQTPIHDPVPVASSEQTAVAANRRSPPPPSDQVHDLSRSDRVAAIESDVVLLEREPPVDPERAKTILDKPPVSGVNSKYVHPQHRVGGLNPRTR